MARDSSNIGSPTNRKLLSWIGGGIATVAVGAWALFTYVFPPDSGHASSNCAENASIATQGDVSHVTVNANGATLNANGAAACGNAASKKP